MFIYSVLVKYSMTGRQVVRGPVVKEVFRNLTHVIDLIKAILQAPEDKIAEKAIVLFIRRCPQNKIRSDSKMRKRPNQFDESPCTKNDEEFNI
jgi:hypothetical protein